MRSCRKRFYSKGSITVEACITLPVFLSVFFLLLFLVKFTCTGMILDHAVNETAKEIAAAAYPISFVNELEDEKIGEYGNAVIPSLEEELGKLERQLEGVGSSNIFKAIISKDIEGAGISNMLKALLEDYSRGVLGGIVDKVTPVYWDMKSAGKYMVADMLINEHLNNPLINKERLRLRLVEFPQGKEEFKARSVSPLYASYGIVPGKDFGIEDVVLQLEYDYKIKLPFIEKLDIKMIHTAVERAWIGGSYGIVTAKDEGWELEPEGTIVFITRTGIRFHRGSCWHLRKSKIPVEISEAWDRGYTPCKVCKPIN